MTDSEKHAPHDHHCTARCLDEWKTEQVAQLLEQHVKKSATTLAQFVLTYYICSR